VPGPSPTRPADAGTAGTPGRLGSFWNAIASPGATVARSILDPRPAATWASIRALLVGPLNLSRTRALAWAAALWIHSGGVAPRPR